MAMKGKKSKGSTHGPMTRSTPRPTGKMKSGQSTSTHGTMRIVQQVPGK